MKQRWLAMFLATVMIAGSLAGCGLSDDSRKENASTSGTAESKKESTEDAAEESAAESERVTHPLTTDPITFTMYVSRSDATVEAKETYIVQYLESFK